MSTLICYDGSPSAKRALSVAASTGGRCAGGPAPCVESASAGAGRQLRPHRARRVPAFAKLEELVEHRAADILADGEALAGRLGFAVTSRQEVNRSTVWQTILDIADEVDAGLIVTGTHGATAVQSELLGSVSNALVHHARRPVLVVPTPEPADG